MSMSIPAPLQAEVNKCLRMIVTCSTQAHFQATSTYLKLWVQTWSRKLKGNSELVLLELVYERLQESLRTEVKKRNLSGWEIPNF